MQDSGDLTSTQWQVADAIARQLVLDDVDVNELKKVMAYLRAYLNRQDAGAKFFEYLKTLARNGSRIGHSQKTQGYYEKIERLCQNYLKGYQNDASEMLIILGWAARLHKYYEKGVPIGEVSVPTGKVQSDREAKVIAMQESLQKLSISELKEGQILDAKVVKKHSKGNKVTYEVLGCEFPEKETRKFDFIPSEGMVKVEVKSLKEDGSINHVKFISNN